MVLWPLLRAGLVCPLLSLYGRWMGSRDVSSHFSILSPYTLHSLLKSSNNQHSNNGSVSTIPKHLIPPKIAVPWSPLPFQEFRSNQVWAL